MTGLYGTGVPLVEVVRSGFVESRHNASLVAVDAAGARALVLGDVDGPVFPRSSNKPMQAVGMLRAGLRLEDEAELALTASSHYGEPMHIDRILRMQRRGGVDKSELLCPPDLPTADRARVDVIRAGGSAERVFMTCSGKHTGMLLTCAANDWNRSAYTAADHPVQRAGQAAIEELAGEKAAATGVDGCGAPVLAISLTGLARAFLQLVNAPVGSPERAVADAMRAYPELVSGTGADDLHLMRAMPGLLSKVGFEGVLCVAAPGAGAVAVKVDDGANRPRLPLIAAGLRHLGISPDLLEPFSTLPVLGGGMPVGTVRMVSTV